MHFAMKGYLALPAIANSYPEISRCKHLNCISWHSGNWPLGSISMYLKDARHCIELSLWLKETLIGTTIYFVTGVKVLQSSKQGFVLYKRRLIVLTLCNYQEDQMSSCGLSANHSACLLLQRFTRKSLIISYLFWQIGYKYEKLYCKSSPQSFPFLSW